jgi:hypothetical protein
VRDRVAWLAAGAGLLGAYLLARSRRRSGAEGAPAVGDDAADDARAAELRQKLAESRALVAERDEFESAETPVDHAETVAERRRRVHEAGRAAAEDMHDAEREEG